jgi:excisionase family DNA binding protein
MSDQIEHFIRSIVREEARPIVEELVREALQRLEAPKKLLTAQEVADIFGVHVMTVYKAKRAGVLPYVATGLKGRNFAFDPDIIEEMKAGDGLRVAEEPRKQSAA